jgi:hypothetical protein
MTEDEGTYSALMELERGQNRLPKRTDLELRQSSEPGKASPPDELDIIPYMSQSYRFTEEEVRWIRQQSFTQTQRLGTRISQNTIVRFALHYLRDACRKNPKRNPLSEAISRLKR